MRSRRFNVAHLQRGGGSPGKGRGRILLTKAVPEDFRAGDVVSGAVGGPPNPLCFRAKKSQVSNWEFESGPRGYSTTSTLFPPLALDACVPTPLPAPLPRAAPNRPPGVAMGSGPFLQPRALPSAFIRCEDFPRCRLGGGGYSQQPFSSLQLFLVRRRLDTLILPRGR